MWLMVAIVEVQAQTRGGQQNQNNFGGNVGGSFGGGGSSSSMFGNTGSSFGSSSFGTSSFGSSSFGNSAFGSAGTGQAGFGQAGVGGAARATGANLNQGANGFIGANANMNNFIGRNIQGLQNAGGAMNQGRQNFNLRGNQQRGLDQSLLNILSGGNQNAMGNNNNNPRNNIRPRQKVSFEHPVVPPTEILAAAHVRLGRLSQRYPSLKNVAIEMDQPGTVVLRGDVDSYEAARLAENLMRLEPGVLTVKNELRYPPPSE